MSEPKLEQVSISASAGGKVTMVKYDVSCDYHLSQSQTYSIPDDWTNDQAVEFQQQKSKELHDVVDAMAQDEYDNLLDNSYLTRG